MSSSLHGVLHVLDSVSNKSRPLALANNVLSVDNSSNTQPISASALPLPAGAATASSNSTDAASIVSAVQSTLIVDGSGVTQPISAALLPLPGGAATVLAQTAIQSSVDSVNTTLGGTLSVSQSVSKAETTLSSSANVAPGDFSSSHDASNHRKIAIFGETTDFSNNIDVYVSQDNSSYYKLGQFSIYPDSAGKFGMVIDSPFKYLKLKYLGTATVTAIAAGSN